MIFAKLPALGGQVMASVRQHKEPKLISILSILIG